MNRLQKKCIIGTVGIHLLLLTILIVGPAFFNPRPKMDNTQVLDVIPANLVDAAVNSGVKEAQPPPPTPVRPPSPPQPQPQYAPPPPRVVQPVTPAPAPTPAPSFLQKVEHYLEPKQVPTVTPDTTSAEKPVKSHHPLKLVKVTRTFVPEKSTQADNSANAREINSTLKSLKKSLSSATTIDMPGNSSASYASYAAVVKSVYEQALRSNVPDQVAHNDENTTVKVTIASDGTVISSEIISPSGDPAWDNAVQRTLDQVTFIAAFPDGATEKERHYTINFNPQVEQSFE